jgi:hypothetical protein
MIRTVSLSCFAMVSLIAGLASADPDSGWAEDESAAAADEQTAEPVAAEAEEAPSPKPAPEKEKAKPATQKASDDPVRDRAPEKLEKNPTAHKHDGFYLRLSMGGGSVGARGDRYDAYQNRSDYEFQGNAFSFDAMVGGTPAPGIVVGGAYLANYAAARSKYGEDPTFGEGDAGFSYGMVGPFVDVYPNPRKGFHIGGSLGPAVSVSYDDAGEQQSIAAGFGAAAWIGYDFWVGDQWSIGGMFRVQGASVETPDSRDMREESPNHDRLGIGSASLMLTALYH